MSSRHPSIITIGIFAYLTACEEQISSDHIRSHLILFSSTSFQARLCFPPPFRLLLKRMNSKKGRRRRARKRGNLHLIKNHKKEWYERVLNIIFAKISLHSFIQVNGPYQQPKVGKRKRWKNRKEDESRIEPKNLLSSLIMFRGERIFGWGSKIFKKSHFRRIFSLRLHAVVQQEKKHHHHQNFWCCIHHDDDDDRMGWKEREREREETYACLETHANNLFLQ